jgi:hypothetical protein
MSRKTFGNYLSHLYFRYVRTRRDGCMIYANRTARGQRLVTGIWVRKYPYLFTREAREQFGR